MPRLSTTVNSQPAVKLKVLPSAVVIFSTPRQKVASFAPFTLKLSVLERAGIKPRKHPLPQGLSTSVGCVQIIDGAGVVGKLNGDGDIVRVKPRGMSGTTRACVGGDDSGARYSEAPI